MSKTIFITGASSGIGKATAKLFASKGWNVIATMRNPEKEEELTKLENVTVMPLDVTNLEQMKETAKKVTESYDVDVLFNNAGYGLSGPLVAYTDEQILRNINTNLLGVIRLTKEFLPFFQSKKGGCIITTTSLAGQVGLPFDSIYNASKWGVEGFSESLTYELHRFGIKVKTVAPGVVSTDFGTRSIDRAPLAPEDEPLSKSYLDYMIGDWDRVSTPEHIADVVYQAATDDKDQVRYIAGIDANEMYDNRLKEGNEIFRRKFIKLLTGKK